MMRVTLSQLGCWMMVAMTAHSVLAQEVDYSSELPRFPPIPANESADSFTIADGFEMQLVASEPLIGSPVTVEWDASGAMFVCEMRGYSEDRDDEISGIARLTDEDGDGVYDHRTQYASGLFWPTGIFPFDGGLFVGDAPDLWYFKDLDNDGIADLKQRVLTGFGTSNVQGLMNSFRWGLDNRIHIACSSVGGEIQYARPDSGEETVRIRGRDLALDPRTLKFIPTSGAAQHGMCFDDWGGKFVSSNSDHIQQVMYEDRYVAANPFSIPLPSRVSIAADGPQAEVFRKSPVEPWRIVRTRLRVSGKAKGPIEGGGRAAGYFTGATGVTIYRGNAWPSQWKGTAIVGDVGSNLIHRKKLSRNGLEFIAKRIDPQSEFVVSKDTWFRPAQFANAPDGSLNVIDVYREVIEHPKSLPEEIKRHLDLTAGRDRGRIYRIVPQNFQAAPLEDLSIATTERLVETLAHENAWHRETAARLLYERQDPSAAPLLKQVAIKHSSPLARMHALYALEGQGESFDAPTLVDALGDPDAHVRRHAVRLSERFAHQADVRKIWERLVDDPSMEVRYQLAFSAAFLAEKDRLRVLESLLRRDHADRWMRFAVLTSAGAVAKRLRVSAQALSQGEKSITAFLTELDKQVAAIERLGPDVSVDSIAHSMSANSFAKTSDLPNRSQADADKRTAIVSDYRRALALPPDLANGEAQFRKHCAACHRVGEIGHPLGPNLAAMKSRGEETLLTSILDPNREVNPLYYNYVVLTLDGRIHAGMVVDEGATSMTLRKSDEATTSLLRIEIEKVKNTGLSLMPEGFEDAMDHQAIADLIAYLMNQ